MKSRIFAIALAVLSLTLGLSSCTKTYIEELEPDVVTFNVPQSAWNYSGDGNNDYFYATVDMPEITNNVYNYGMVKVYRILSESQIELPYVRPVEVCVDEDYNIWADYTEVVDYEFQPGLITVYYTESDFYYEDDETFVPEAMNFRVVIYE